MVKFLIFLLFLGNTIITVSAQEVPAYLRQIDSLIEADQFEMADSLLDIVEKDNNLKSDSWYGIYANILGGDLRLTQNRNKEAVSYYQILLDAAWPKDTLKAFKFAKGLNDMGIACYRLGKMDLAKKAHGLSITLCKKYNDRQGLAYNYNNLSIIAKEQLEMDKAFDYLQKSLEAAKSINDSLGVGFNHMNLAVLHTENKEPVKAIEHSYQAIAVFSALHRDFHANLTRLRLGKIYHKLHAFDSARSIFNQVKEYFINTDDHGNLSHVYRHMADLFIKQKQLDSAMYFLNRALEYFLSVNENKPIANIYHQVGIIFKITEDKDSARYYFERSLDYSRGVNIGIELTSRLALAKLLLDDGEFEKAINEVDKVKIKGKDNLRFGHEQSIYSTLYKANKALGNSSEALHNLETLKQVRDSLFNEEKALEIARVEYRNQLAIKEAAEAVERERLRLKYQKDLDKQQWIKLSAIGGVLCFFIISALLYRSHVLKKKHNDYLAKKNSMIIAANSELRALREKDRINQLREKQLMDKSIATKERELAATVMINHEKNKVLSRIDQKLSEMVEMVEEDVRENLMDLKKSVSSNLNFGESWDSFIHQFVTVHPDFFKSLKNQNPDLTLHDLKLCAYLKIGMDNKNIAQVTNVAPDSVKKSIFRLRKKLKLDPEQNLRRFIMQLSS